MDAESARAFLLTLPHVVETEQWGNNLLFWVGDKAIGGKMFALIDLDGDLTKGVATFSAGPERFAELLEREGLKPAPYFARIYWIAAERWSALRTSEWHEMYEGAHALTFAKLPPKVQASLALPAKEQAKLIAERRKVLEAKAKNTAAKKAAAKKAASSKRSSKGS